MVRPVRPAVSTITLQLPAKSKAAQLENSTFDCDYYRSRIDKSMAYGATNNNYSHHSRCYKYCLSRAHVALYLRQMFTFARWNSFFENEVWNSKTEIWKPRRTSCCTWWNGAENTRSCRSPKYVGDVCRNCPGRSSNPSAATGPFFRQKSSVMISYSHVDQKKGRTA